MLALPAIACFADSAPSVSNFIANGFPDNVDVRGKVFAYVIGAPRDVAFAYGEKQLRSSAGAVTVRIEKRSADFIVEFLNPSASGDGAGRGSCYVLRSNAKGNYIQQARILLEDDPGCYLALYPSGSGTRGDVVMYGAVIKKGLYFSDMIYRILLLSFSDIVDSTRGSFDWGAVFKFGGKDPASNYVADLRSSLNAAPVAAADSGAASSSPIALSHNTGKIALAAAPSLPAPGSVDPTTKGPRAGRISELVDRSSSFESLVLELGSSGESSLREIAPSADTAYVDDKGEIAKLVYGDYPRYDAKGLPLAAIRSALYLDLSANPDSVYALVGDGLRATIVPTFDGDGRLIFSFFSGGKEMSWDDFSAGKRDLKVRILRLSA
jgi:hypothetical protein